MLTLRPIKTRSRFGSGALLLNLASIRNSPDRSTKSTRLHLNVLPQLVNTGFQVLFHSPPGVLFTFPSQYYALSVTKEYLALGWSPEFPWQFHVSRGTLILPLLIVFMYEAFLFSAGLFQDRSINESAPCAVCNPRVHALCLKLFPFRSPLLRESMFLFFLRLLRCFQFSGSFHTLCIGVWMTEVCSAGFPHSDICGSMDICSSPKLFAAYHVFHRLLVPRHPPCALISLTN